MAIIDRNGYVADMLTIWPGALAPEGGQTVVLGAPVKQVASAQLVAVPLAGVKITFIWLVSRPTLALRITVAIWPRVTVQVFPVCPQLKPCTAVYRLPCFTPYAKVW